MKKNDNSLFIAYEKNLKQFRNSVVKAGVLMKDGNQKHDESSLTVFQIGMIHEFGVPEKNIPRRSFIRVPIENAMKDLVNLIETNHKKVEDNSMSAKVALDRLGIQAQNIIKQSFRNNDWKPLNPKTIKRKGSSTPLIDTGQLIGSISYIVENEGVQ